MVGGGRRFSRILTVKNEYNDNALIESFYSTLKR